MAFNYSAFFELRRGILEFGGNDDCANLWRRRPIAQSSSIMSLIKNYDEILALPRSPTHDPPLQRKIHQHLLSP
eukprot:2574880-Pyramimonas_sp.AAC.1